MPTLYSLQVKQLTATVLLQGILLLLFPLASSYIELVALSAAYGLTFGATVSIHITVLSEVVGVHRLGSALGFFMLIRSGGGLLGPPIAGKSPNVLAQAVNRCKHLIIMKSEINS